MRPLLALLLTLVAGPVLADGKDTYNDQCASCHALTPASTANGPSLIGVVWRKIAVLPDFTYSSALKNKVGAWTPDRLDVFLADTQGFAPGGDMFFEIREPATRRALIDYLQTLK